MTSAAAEVTLDPLAALRGLLAVVEQQLRAAVNGKLAACPLPELGACPTLRALVERCELSAFEAQIVLLGAAMELQPAVAGLCAQVSGQPSAPWPTFRVAMKALPGAHWDALLPSSPLRSLRLIQLADGPVLTERPLYLAERVLHALLGSPDLDPRVLRRVRRLARPEVCPESHAALIPRAHAAWQAGARVHVQAPRSDEAAWWAAEAGALGGFGVYAMGALDVPADAADLEELVALWNREARLSRVALVVELDERLEGVQLRAARELLQQVDGPVVAVSSEPLTDVRGDWTRLLLPELRFAERRSLWQATIDPSVEIAEGDLDDLAARFELGAAQIHQVGRELALRSEEGAARVLWEASRALSRPRLADLAQRVTPSAGGGARLVLPDVQLRMLDALVAQVKHKATVQHRWGLARAGSRGAGTSAVFSGPSGTGKTLAAEVLARRLELDLYRIDLSAVVSKYIGETEKNLKRVFDAAEAGGAVLLFDEADALFGKRTEVRDSHDRHANIEVSYLLQRMEAYGGLAILTTNFRKAIDDAFLRRIQFVVEFPFPDEQLRARIWEGIFPPEMPTEDLDLRRLAQLSVPGGNIHSIARNAAYLAADAGTPVTMRLILDAARLEAEKIGRGLTPRELSGWPR
ncbi:MAG TPA: ATP-binding protein [Polyangiaceae bacterium]|nr:ATP-binding protein [Polyangiaceae bacterium]